MSDNSFSRSPYTSRSWSQIEDSTVDSDHFVSSRLMDRLLNLIEAERDERISVQKRLANALATIESDRVDIQYLNREREQLTEQVDELKGENQRLNQLLLKSELKEMMSNDHTE